VAQLGNQTIGTTFFVTGSFGDLAGGPYTVPSPGILVSQLHAYAGNHGTGNSGKLYVWKASGGIPGAWLLRSGAFAFPGSTSWNARSDINVNTGQLSSDGYIPAGTVIWIGYFSNTGISDCEGRNAGTTELGFTADGNWSDQGAAGGGMGQLAAYIDYTVLGNPTISSATPNVGTTGTSVAVVGTSFLHATTVTINGAAASFSIVDDTHITATVPSGANPGVGSLVVNNPAGGGSISFTVGQIFYGPGGAPVSIKAIWYGTGSGVAKIIGVWVPTGGPPPTGVKRIW